MSLGWQNLVSQKWQMFRRTEKQDCLSMQVNGDSQLSFIICGHVFADRHIRIGRYVVMPPGCKIMKKTDFHQIVIYEVLSPTSNICYKSSWQSIVKWFLLLLLKNTTGRFWIDLNQTTDKISSTFQKCQPFKSPFMEVQS